MVRNSYPGNNAQFYLRITKIVIAQRVTAEVGEEIKVMGPSIPVIPAVPEDIVSINIGVDQEIVINGP